MRIDVSEAQLELSSSSSGEGIDAFEVEGNVLRVLGWFESWPDSFNVGVRLTVSQRRQLIAALGGVRAGLEGRR